jgi:hypothetical protein
MNKLNISNVKFSLNEDKEALYYIFSHTEISVSKRFQTKDMFNKLKQLGYINSYSDDYDDCTVYGFENPSGLWNFENITDFFKAYKDNSNDIQKNLDECISIPFSWKILVTGVY